MPNWLRRSVVAALDSASRSSRARSASSSLRSEMSRAIFEAPMTRPSSSRIGDTVSEIGMSDPFLRRRMVSKWSTPRLARMRASTSSSSPCRSSGMSMRMDWPTASSAV